MWLRNAKSVLLQRRTATSEVRKLLVLTSPLSPSPGRSCYSCRSFFRRTVKRVQTKGLKKCKRGTADCPVSQSAKSCIHCRYNKCLKIGMNPELIRGPKRKAEMEENDEDSVEESESSVTVTTEREEREWEGLEFYN